MSFTFRDRTTTRRTALAALGGLPLGLAAGLRIGGAGRTFAQEATPSAADYPEVVVTAVDYRLELPASIPAGLTRVTLRHEGTTAHHAMFLRLNDGADMADLEAALETPNLGAVFAVSTSLGGPEVDPGRSASVIMDLLPGRYRVICLIPGDDGTPHYMMGMQTPVEVTEPASAPDPAPAAPVADATVELVDFGFHAMPMEFAAGRHVWEVPNVGEQLHQLLVMRQKPGVTFDDIQVALAPPPPATPGAVAEASPETEEAVEAESLYTMVGGAAPMSPGQTVWSELDLEPGDYFAICFIPDPATGAPHFALGMIMPMTVT